MWNKTETIVSYNDEEVMVETLVTSWKGSFFIVFNKETKDIQINSTFSKNWKEFKPIDINSNFIKNWSILFSSGIMEYWTKKDLLRDINSYLNKYIDIPQEYRVICTYYVLLTYLYTNFNEIPYLRVIWDYWSWKSRLLKTVWNICYTPIITNWWTSLSALFRMIEIFKWTLVLDEADFWVSDTTSDMIKLLNNGYQKWSSIMRADWEKFEVKCYNVFWPKIIWWRREFVDKATESRCLSNIMKRSNRKDIPISLTDDFHKDSLELRNKLLKFRFDYHDNIELKNYYLEEVEPRLNQIINPILSLIDSIDIKDLVIKSLVKKQNEIKEERKNSIFWAILLIIKIKFESRGILYLKDILKDLTEIEWKNSFTHRKLWSLLRQNSLKINRKNKWTVVEKIINKDELNRLYKEYSII